MPVILATQEAEIRRIANSLVDPMKKKTHPPIKGWWGSSRYRP
jgi:hypothetical protein